MSFLLNIWYTFINFRNIVNNQIKWVLTVPAIWDENAKAFKRKAAEHVSVLKYNIPKQSV
jgi:hypothetical protein